MTEELKFIAGGLSIDDRGSISFCNDFDMSEVKRFYSVSSHQSNFVRAWHGHKKESKYIFVSSGAALVQAVKVDNWEKPDKRLSTSEYVLDERKPGVLFIPGGFAHGFMTLRGDTSVTFFSTCRLEESLDDDYRFPYDFWGSWTIVNR